MMPVANQTQYGYNALFRLHSSGITTPCLPRLALYYSTRLDEIFFSCKSDSLINENGRKISELSGDANVTNKHNAMAKARWAYHAYLISEMYHNLYFICGDDLKTDYSNAKANSLRYAREALDQAEALDPLHAQTFWARSMEMESRGIDCNKVDQVVAFMRELTLARALDNGTDAAFTREVEETINETGKIMAEKWTAALQKFSVSTLNIMASTTAVGSKAISQGRLVAQDSPCTWFAKLNAASRDDEVIIDLFHKNTSLFEILYREDHHLQLQKMMRDYPRIWKKSPLCSQEFIDFSLKGVFSKNPSFFALSSDKNYAEFFNAHPELKSQEAFSRKYVPARPVPTAVQAAAPSPSALATAKKMIWTICSFGQKSYEAGEISKAQLEAFIARFDLRGKSDCEIYHLYMQICKGKPDVLSGMIPSVGDEIIMHCIDGTALKITKKLDMTYDVMEIPQSHEEDEKIIDEARGSLLEIARQLSELGLSEDQLRAQLELACMKQNSKV